MSKCVYCGGNNFHTSFCDNPAQGAHDTIAYLKGENARLLEQSAKQNAEPNLFGTCGCGRPTRYMVGSPVTDPKNATYACNKYSRCPTYEEIGRTLTSRTQLLRNILPHIKDTGCCPLKEYAEQARLTLGLLTPEAALQPPTEGEG